MAKVCETCKWHGECSGCPGCAAWAPKWTPTVGEWVKFGRFYQPGYIIGEAVVLSVNSTTEEADINWVEAPQGYAHFSRVAFAHLKPLWDGNYEAPEMMPEYDGQVASDLTLRFRCIRDHIWTLDECGYPSGLLLNTEEEPTNAEFDEGFLPSEKGSVWTENRDEDDEVPELETEYDGAMKPVHITSNPEYAFAYSHECTNAAYVFAGISWGTDPDGVGLGLLPSEKGSVWAENKDDVHYCRECARFSPYPFGCRRRTRDWLGAESACESFQPKGYGKSPIQSAWEANTFTIDPGTATNLEWLFDTSTDTFSKRTAPKEPVGPVAFKATVTGRPEMEEVPELVRRLRDAARDHKSGVTAVEMGP